MEDKPLWLPAWVWQQWSIAVPQHPHKNLVNNVCVKCTAMASVFNVYIFFLFDSSLQAHNYFALLPAFLHQTITCWVSKLQKVFLVRQQHCIFLCPCLIYVIKSLGEPSECWAFCLFLKKIAVEVHLQQEHNSSSTYCHKVNDISCHVKWIYLLWISVRIPPVLTIHYQITWDQSRTVVQKGFQGAFATHKGLSVHFSFYLWTKKKPPITF